MRYSSLGRTRLSLLPWCQAWLYMLWSWKGQKLGVWLASRGLVNQYVSLFCLCNRMSNNPGRPVSVNLDLVKKTPKGNPQSPAWVKQHTVVVENFHWWKWLSFVVICFCDITCCSDWGKPCNIIYVNFAMLEEAVFIIYLIRDCAWNIFSEPQLFRL